VVEGIMVGETEGTPVGDTDGRGEADGAREIVGAEVGANSP
jgi:hypothetical protein